ncbi:AAA family ATPase [Spirosoma pulveris]
MTITEYHRAIFDFLEDYRARHPEAKLTYSLRSKNTAGRAKNDYLFTGNDKYIAVGLYAPHNGNTKTRSISFICQFDNQLNLIRCSLDFVYDDPKLHNQETVYQQIIERIGASQFHQFSNKRYSLSYDGPDIITNLTTYLISHKPIIDGVIEEAGFQTAYNIPMEKLNEQIGALQTGQQITTQTSDTVNYYCVGTTFDKDEEQLDRFIREGIWENGYGFTKPTFTQIIKAVKPGDRLAAKSAFTKGPKEAKQSILRIKAIGTVRENSEDGVKLLVDWEQPFVSFDLPGKGSYRDTIEQVKHKEDIALIFSHIENSVLDRQAGGQPEFSKNCILYGPPGTGKTYETIGLAVEIIDGKRADTHRENKNRFDELREAKQIDFVTFHQNYTYEDFVVGIRPDTTAGTLMFEPNYGIFYNIAARARANYKQSKEPNAALAQRPFYEVFAELIEPLVDRDEPVAIRMAKGKTFEMTAVSDRNIDFEKSNGSTIHALSIATLKRAYEGLQEIRSDGLGVYYRPLVQKLWEMGKLNDVNRSTWSEHPQRYVLIIDEINRANMSRVFGELITLLEDDKRLGEENALTVTLPNSELFNVPPNLYIVGTMNTADKSLALLDVALRRRFEFIGKYPQPSLLSVEAKPLLERLNKAIFHEKRSTDFLIGHAYFMGKSPLEAVMSKRVFPLLMEYFGGNQSRVEKLLQDADIPFHNDPVTYQLCYGSATSH